jgi:hypothetical protein
MKADGFESASMVETFPKNFQPVESRATARHKDSTEALSSLLYVSVAIHRARTGGIWDGSRFEYAERIGSEPIARCSRLDYALGMLFGPRGFIGYNPALYLSLIAVCMLIARDDEQLPEVIFAGCCMVGTWILYSLLSSNYSGVCCSSLVRAAARAELLHPGALSE